MQTFALPSTPRVWHTSRSIRHQQPVLQRCHQSQHLNCSRMQPAEAACICWIAVLECEDAERWQGYTEKLWKSVLQEQGDCWTIYQACKGQLPSPDEAASFDAIIISGSHYSVYEQHIWIQQLLKMLPQYAATGTHMYGCCFGSQILAQALGGSVGPNPDGRFVLTLEQVTPTPQLEQFTQLHAVVQQALAASAPEALPLAADTAAGKEAAADVTASKQISADSAAARTTAAAAAAVETSNGSLHGSSEEASSSSSKSSSSTALSASLKQSLDAMSLGKGISSSISSSSSDGISSGNEPAAALAVSAVAAHDREAEGSCNGTRGDAVEASCASSNGSNGSVRSCCFRLIESHGDQVLKLPPGAVLLASSPTASHELWSWGSSVLASQFHLEFDEPLVLDKIWTRLTDVGRLDEVQSSESKRVLEAGGQHNKQMLQVIKHFLKHGVQ